MVTSSGEGAYGIHPPTSSPLPANTDAGNEEVRELKNCTLFPKNARPPGECGAWEGSARLQSASGGELRHRMVNI